MGRNKALPAVAMAALAVGLAACGSSTPKPPPPVVSVSVEVPSVPATKGREAEVVGRMVVLNTSGKADRLIRVTTAAAASANILETVPPPPPGGPARIVPDNITTPDDPPSLAAPTTDPDGRQTPRLRNIARDGTAPSDYLVRQELDQPLSAGGGRANEVARDGTAPADAQARAQILGEAPIPKPVGAEDGPPLDPQPIPLRSDTNDGFRAFVRATAESPEEAAKRKAEETGKPTVRVTNQGVPIPAGGQVVFQPGGYQIQFNRVPRALASGSSFRVTLHFQNAGTVTVPFVVRTPADERKPFPPPSRRNPYTPADKTPADTGPPPALVVPTIRN